MPQPARVLIVDDSRLFRAVLEEALSGQEGTEVVGSAFSGEKALEFLHSQPADVVTLDVDMPGMNGLEALKEILRLNVGRPPETEVGVIMVSALTRRGADVTVQALGAGAFDFVTKPSGPSSEENLALLRRQLVTKILLFVASRRKRLSAPVVLEAGGSPRRLVEGIGRRRRWLETAGDRKVRAVVMAASTGGPRALEALMPELCRRVEAPILVVQHMPPEFTGSLAESLGRLVSGAVTEASDGEPILPRRVYIAPGGKHLVLRGNEGGLVAGLNEGPPEGGCRPAADVLFRSAAAVLRGKVVAVVLTGMGSDGTGGLGPLKRAGAYAIAQDEASSVVWGMPGRAVEAGLIDEVLPLEKIPEAVGFLAGGGER
jgi:two-component system chemotaxis response regulator CheB